MTTEIRVFLTFQESRHHPKLYDIRPLNIRANITRQTCSKTTYDKYVQTEALFLSKPNSKGRLNKSILELHQTSLKSLSHIQSTMCKERKWRYRCDCQTTTIQPCRHRASKTVTQRLVCDRCRTNEEDRLAPSQLLQAWTLLRRAGGVQQNVCLRQPTWSTRVSALAGSDQWPEVMESFENEPVSSEQEDSDSEKSDLNKLMMAANPSGHGSRWRRNSLARRKRRFARASRA